MSPNVCCLSMARAASSFARAANSPAISPTSAPSSSSAARPTVRCSARCRPSTQGDSRVYEIRGGERERLLGRTTRVVALHPRDEYRYGYRLWIDEQTSMPLKTQLCDQSGAVIEQIVFSTIDLPERIPDSMFKPQMDASNYRWLRAERRWRATPLRRCGRPCDCPPASAWRRVPRRPCQAPVSPLRIWYSPTALPRFPCSSSRAKPDTSRPKGPPASGPRRRSPRWSMATRSRPSAKCRRTQFEFIAKQVKVSKAAAATAAAARRAWGWRPLPRESDASCRRASWS